MTVEDLPLFAWQRPRTVIPFPGRRRLGHANRIAIQLSKARTQREANHIVSRATATFWRQMLSAGVTEVETSREIREFLIAVNRQCATLDSAWQTHVPPLLDRQDPGGAA